MGRKILICTVVLFLLHGLAVAVSAQEEFSFYGLKFAMSRSEAQAVFPSLEGDLVRDPGHGMSSLELIFDREDLLMEIRAAYPRPEGKLEEVAVKRALREKFFLPTGENHPEVQATLDEYSNQTAYTVIFLSSTIREKNIEYFKGEFLKGLE